MAEYGTNGVQTIAPGGFAVFDLTLIPCPNNFVRHSDGTTNFILSGWVPYAANVCPCRNRDVSAEYLVDLGANIALAEGATVEPISMVITVDGSPLPLSTMLVTPAAVGDYFNIARSLTVDIFNGCCQSLAVQNNSAQSITLQNGLIRFARPDLYATR